MRRRDFIAGLTSAAAVAVTARAQQTKVPVVGLLSGGSFEGPYAVPVAAIRQGLQEAGFIESRNVAIEYRSADGHYERLPELTADLIRRPVTVIIAFGAAMHDLVAKAAPSTIPIVFATGSDALEIGVFSGRERPEVNVPDPVATSGAPSKRL